MLGVESGFRKRGSQRDFIHMNVNYLKTQQETHKSDPKKFWKTISSIFPNNKASQSTIWLKDEGSKSTIAQREIPDYMNSFFTNVGPNLAKKCKGKWKYYGEVSEDDIPEFRTDVDEVIELCREIEPLKSSGIDELSSKICKDAFLALPDKLTHIFNCSLIQGIFPDEWKVAKVVPLFKGGNRELVNNYRPISLLPLPGKLLKKIVHKYLVKFFDDCEFLSAYQGGFRKGFSTVSTIADLTDDLFSEINKGNTTIAAFIDLKKAFDTVNTEILLRKLEKAGICNKTLDWCCSYLSDRSQRTIVNNLSSKTLDVTCGVPQGSVLGPLFFLVYINDIQGALQETNLRLYADDTVLYHSGVNATEATKPLQKGLDKFCEWCTSNKLSVNAQKTKVMAFGSRSKVKKAKNLAVFMNGEKLQTVPTYKYLGLILDSTLNYNHHIMTVVRTVLHKMTLLAKMKKYLKTDVAVHIYKSLLLPYLDYSDIVFHRSNSGNLDKLQRLQNRCLRICLGVERNFDSMKAHKTTVTPYLEDRRKAHTLNFMFIRKARKHLLNNREIRTRAHDAPLFQVEIPRCEAFKRSVGYHGALEWNNLDPPTRNTDSYLLFKFNRKKEMLKPLDLIRLNGN